ncbi:hypothetical protein NSK_002468 [Nannochloropsis salina CCMP1776]|uniref:Uncharacterized protein n=1 Tax=Nannochloropsis salina CCMP1776 TaxID=1027361 RepID=A0A4D9D493_9STRA|nr:hypothetical protein NSK_002468 [Nannochloropsis salina CCMP1776]|eukprot:TFJ86260.1 hypothetical protein NSK_002468 [Nannochloropsis salina CCMP1776]
MVDYYTNTGTDGNRGKGRRWSTRRLRDTSIGKVCAKPSKDPAARKEEIDKIVAARRQTTATGVETEMKEQEETGKHAVERRKTSGIRASKACYPQGALVL